MFRAHGLAELVDVYALSWELGAQKPDRVVFEPPARGPAWPRPTS
ncbi:hypothetical protein [Kitasatospora sp. NPDC018619]